MVSLNKNPDLKIASEVSLVLEEDLKLVHPIAKKDYFTKRFYLTFPWQGDSNIFTKTGNL